MRCNVIYYVAAGGFYAVFGWQKYVQEDCATDYSKGKLITGVRSSTQCASYCTASPDCYGFHYIKMVEECYFISCSDTKNVQHGIGETNIHFLIIVLTVYKI